MKKYATTFGGSEFKESSPQYQEGILLGEFLAEKGYTVKNGGYYGLMEAVSKGVKNKDGICIGITNKSFDPKKANQFITEELKANDLFERLRILTVGSKKISASELIIVQEGMIGTINELFVIWDLLYTKTILNVRVCLLGSYWKSLIESLKTSAINIKEFQYVEIYESLCDLKMTFE